MFELDKNGNIEIFQKFTYKINFKSVERIVYFDIQIPLSGYESMDEFIAYIIKIHNISVPFHYDFCQNLTEFLSEETWKNENKISDILMVKMISRNNNLDDIISKCVSLLTPKVEENSLSFVEKFKFLMNHACNDAIESILAIEKNMAEKMLSLVRARDFELDRLRRDCEAVVNQVLTLEKVLPANSDQQLHISKLNAKIRQVSNSYSNQIAELAFNHRLEYQNTIQSLFECGEIPVNIKSNILPHGLASMRKSNSAIANMNSLRSEFKQHLNESFSIYLGAQLKTMHNVRLLSCGRLTDICRSKSAFDCKELESGRLQMNLSLYRRGLSGLILLVKREPMYHIDCRTDFARICEQSTELHFGSLQTQLKNISSLAPKVLGKGDSGDCSGNVKLDNLLSIGDVYVTKHSNLTSVQVIFHLVTDRTLDTVDLSSRHPCVDGLRNVILLCSKFGVTTFSLPLFLVDEVTEKMASSWYLKRAELIFKCVKGFLIEACAGCSTYGGGLPAAPIHYNLNFILPEYLENCVYEQIDELLPTIFHLVPSVTVRL